MPYLIPTPDEIAAMGKRERDQWAKRLGVTRTQLAETRAYLSHGETVREEATVWERIIGPDPDAALHLAELEAIVGMST